MCSGGEIEEDFEIVLKLCGYFTQEMVEEAKNYMIISIDEQNA